MAAATSPGWFSRVQVLPRFNPAQVNPEVSGEALAVADPLELVGRPPNNPGTFPARHRRPPLTGASSSS
jgi:hypothetical protein